MCHHDSCGNDLNETAGKSYPNAEVKCVIDDRQPGVKPAKRSPSGLANEHAICPHCENVTHRVVLTLVEFIFNERNRLPARREGLTKLENRARRAGFKTLRLVLLWADHDRGTRHLECAHEVLQRGGLWCAVLPENPQAIVARWACSHNASRHVYGFTQWNGTARRQDVRGARILELTSCRTS
ncbi:unannotated protein [freshwater metagenome]|uniref:Unannotated protein n=1 Tax=freshwater metagenome TaxID=449393 RepID=A0A6J6DM74_9ZZZZ